MDIKPLFENVLVKPVTKKKDTEAGIILPESANNDDIIYATVISVGAGDILPVTLLSVGGIPELARTTVVVKVNDQIIFKKYAGTLVQLNKEKHYLVNQHEILAVITE